MDIDTYQDTTEETAVYPNETGLIYTSLGLNDEAGEVAGAVKKHIRGDYDEEELRDRVRDEAGDVLWYWARLLDELNINASEVMQRNTDKLSDRQERGVIKGDGDNR